MSPRMHSSRRFHAFSASIPGAWFVDLAAPEPLEWIA
jgi:hypothetical protein